MDKALMDMLNDMGFSKQVERVKTNRCPFCNKRITLLEFTNELARKEYKISGLCQSCQDDFFD